MATKTALMTSTISTWTTPEPEEADGEDPIGAIDNLTTIMTMTMTWLATIATMTLAATTTTIMTVMTGTTPTPCMITITPDPIGEGGGTGIGRRDWEEVFPRRKLLMICISPVLLPPDPSEGVLALLACENGERRMWFGFYFLIDWKFIHFKILEIFGI